MAEGGSAGDFRLVDHTKEPFHVWETPDPEKFYVIGIDVAEGTGSKGADYSAIEVLDVETCRQVAEYHSNFIDPFDLGRKAATIGRFYAGCAEQAHIVVECNNHGLCTLGTLRDECSYWNLYSRPNPNSKKSGAKGVLGFQTNVNTRQYLVDEGRRIFRHLHGKYHCFNYGTPVRSRRLLNELRAFVYSDSGKPEAAPGEHDDLVMAWLLATWGRRYAWMAAPNEKTNKRKNAPVRGTDEWVHAKEKEVIAAFMEEKGDPFWDMYEGEDEWKSLRAP